MKEQVLQLRAKGKTYKEISAITGLSKGTISYHCVGKKQKLLYNVKRRKKIKETLIAYKGGKCVKCGYKKCTSALEFHHKDPTNKSFSIAVNRSYTVEKLKKEVDKCILICANCHRELHELAALA